MKISVKEKMKEAEQMSLQYPYVLYRVMDKTGQRAIVTGNPYHALGGNGMITKMMHEIEELHLKKKEV